MAAPKKTPAKAQEETKVEEAPVEEEAPEVEAVEETKEVVPEPEPVVEEAPAVEVAVDNSGEIEAVEHNIAKHLAIAESLKARLAELKS